MRCPEGSICLSAHQNPQSCSEGLFDTQRALHLEACSPAKQQPYIRNDTWYSSLCSTLFTSLCSTFYASLCSTGLLHEMASVRQPGGGCSQAVSCVIYHKQCRWGYLRIGSEGTNFYFASCNGSVRVYDNGKEGLLILLLSSLSPYVNA